MYKKVIVIFVIAIIISGFLISANEKEFDQTVWNNDPAMRYKMADDIITSEIFLGQTKQEVLSQLGEPLSSNFEGRDHVIYALGKPPSFFEDNTQNLVLIFKNGRVTKVIRSEE